MQTTVTTTTLCYETGLEDDQQSVDLYFPSNASSSSPLIVLSLKKDGQDKSPIQHPNHIMDVGKSIAYLFDMQSSQDRKYDPEQIYLVGHSAGAHIASMLLLDTQLPYHQYIQGIVGVSGIYDIPLLLKRSPSYIDFIEQAFGPDRATYKEASPISKMSLELGSKPIIIAQSREDSLVHNEQAEAMAEHLRSFHSNVTLDMSLSGDHYDIMKSEKLRKFVEALLK
ncbi:MAG: Alpha/Beta hydrolase protein [Benjaminiella poitrasii]|nr:MAG: Alpha/Beta hydrolase protein [Benjaminiella poitrasii]